MTAAPVLPPVRGPVDVGETASGARQPLLPGMEGYEQPRMREMQQEAAPSYEAAAKRAQISSALAGLGSVGADPAWMYQLSAAMARGAAPSMQRYRPVPAYADPTLTRPAPLSGLLTGPDFGLALEDADAGMRAELARQSQALSYARRAWQPYRGADREPAADTAVQLPLMEDAVAAAPGWDRLAARAETLPWAMQDLARQLNGEHKALKDELSRRRVQGIAGRQRTLVQALQRAQRRLGFSDAVSLNADPRGSIVGEAFRSRFIIAQFESNAALEQLSGVFYSGEM